MQEKLFNFLSVNLLFINKELKIILNYFKNININTMNAKNFIMESIDNYSDMTCNIIGEVFYVASSHGHDKLIIDNIKFIDYVEDKKMKEIINNLFKNKKYNMIMILSSQTKKITLNTFCIYEIYNMIKETDFGFVKKFITLFPNIILKPDNIECLVNNLYCYGIDIIDFIMEICQDKKLINKYLKKFVLISCTENNLDVLKYLFEKYYDEINNFTIHILEKIYVHNRFLGNKINVNTLDFIFEKYSYIEAIDEFIKTYLGKILKQVVSDLCKRNNVNDLVYLFEKYYDKIGEKIFNIVIKLSSYYKISTKVLDLIFKTYLDTKICNDEFYNKFYNILFKHNDIVIMKYMFDNYNNHYKIYNDNIDYFHDNTIRLIIDDIINKKINISIYTVNDMFHRCCRCGDYDYAYMLKYYWPEINHFFIGCDKRYTKLYNWLQDGCPINCSTTKSARKVV